METIGRPSSSNLPTCDTEDEAASFKAAIVAYADCFGYAHGGVAGLTLRTDDGTAWDELT